MTDTKLFIILGSITLLVLVAAVLAAVYVPGESTTGERLGVLLAGIAAGLLLPNGRGR